MQRFTHYLLIAALWAMTCLPNLGGPSLWDIDEGNNATCGYEMLTSGNWIVPTFNYCLREDKPALIYWLQIGCFSLLGVNETAARLPSALAALFTIVVVYELGRRMFGVGTGLLAGLILGGSVGLLGAAHFANPDALLVAFCTLTLALVWTDQQGERKSSLAWIGVACGLAVLAKGPIGALAPAGICVVYFAWQRQLSRLLDWRLGERHFMRQLVDGDLASNNGGWQWAASTGTDSQPYFRIFNPILQGERFDPEGVYASRWLPELSKLPTRWIHRPWEAPAQVLHDAGVALGVTYPPPIVDHLQQRDRAVAMYRKAGG